MAFNDSSNTRWHMPILFAGFLGLPVNMLIIRQYICNAPCDWITYIRLFMTSFPCYRNEFINTTYVWNSLLFIRQTSYEEIAQISLFITHLFCWNKIQSYAVCLTKFCKYIDLWFLHGTQRSTFYYQTTCTLVEESSPYDVCMSVFS